MAPENHSSQGKMRRRFMCFTMQIGSQHLVSGQLPTNLDILQPLGKLDKLSMDLQELLEQKTKMTLQLCRFGNWNLDFFTYREKT